MLEPVMVVIEEVTRVTIDVGVGATDIMMKEK